MASTRIRTGTIAVHGLDDLSRALKALDPGLQKELRATNKKVAEGVAAKARGRASSIGGVAAHVAPSLKATAGAKSASVGGGGSAHPAFGGAEFGGRGRPTTQQFQPWRGSGPGAGYFVYPTIRDEAPRITDDYREAIDAVTRKAGLA